MNSNWNSLIQALTNPLVWMAILIVCSWLIIYRGYKYSFRLKQKQMYLHPKRQKWKMCSLWMRIRLKVGWTQVETTSALIQLEQIWQANPLWYDHKLDQWKTTLKIRRVVFVYKFCCFYGTLIVNILLMMLMAWLMS